MNLLLGFVVSMSVTMLLIPPLMRLAARGHLLDQPAGRKIHTAPIPRVGGIAMAIGVLLALVLWGTFDRMLQAFCAGLVILLVFGIWDDWTPLKPATKFLGQGLAVLVAMSWGGIDIASITVADRVILPPWVSAPLTFLFLVGVTNAVNLADGLDGLAGGAALLCLGALALLAFSDGDATTGSIALVIAGAIFGFLRFNTHPARVFMGDCGSQMLGFSVAVLSVILTQNPQVPLSSALPLLLLGIPIMDTLTVMTERLLAGRSPFNADKTHLHHRLLALGLQHHEAVAAIYVMQALLFIAAWFLRYQPDATIAVVFLAFLLSVTATMRIAAARGWRLRGARASSTGSAPRSNWYVALNGLGRAADYLIGVCIAGFCAGLLVLGQPLGSDVRILAAVVDVFLLGNMLVRRRARDPGWIEKCATYLVAVFAIYINGNGAGGAASFHQLEWTVLPVLLLAVLIRLCVSQERQFKMNPLDLLVVFLAIAVPNLPGSIISQHDLGAIAAKLILLIYALELLAISLGGYWRWLNLASIGFLAVCALHAA